MTLFQIIRRKRKTISFLLSTLCLLDASFTIPDKSNCRALSRLIGHRIRQFLGIRHAPNRTEIHQNREFKASSFNCSNCWLNCSHWKISHFYTLPLLSMKSIDLWECLFFCGKNVFFPHSEMIRHFFFVSVNLLCTSSDSISRSITLIGFISNLFDYECVMVPSLSR